MMTQTRTKKNGVIKSTDKDGVTRIPFPKPELLEQLGELQRDAISLINSSSDVDTVTKKEFAWRMLAAADIPVAVQVERAVFGGPLQHTTFDRLARNPDPITYESYDKMSYDPQIALATAMIKAPIISLPWRIECSDLKLKGIIQHSLEFKMSVILSGLLDAIRFGRQAAEIVIGNEDIEAEDITDVEGSREVLFRGNAAVLKKVKFLSPKSYKILVDTLGNMIGIRQTQQGFQDVDFGMEQLLFFANDVEFGNWYGKSRYKNVYRPYYWGEILMQFMLRYFERRSIPPVKVNAPPGKTRSSGGTEVDNFDIALKMGESLISNSVVVVPTQFDKAVNKELWGISYLSDENRTSSFTEVINLINLMKMRGMLFPDKSITDDAGKAGGTFSQSSTHFDGFVIIEEALIGMVEDVVNAQLVKPLVMYNTTPKSRPRCVLRFDRLNFQRKVLLKEIFIRMLIMLNGSAKDGITPKLIPSMRAMAQTLNIPLDPFDGLFNVDEPLEPSDPDDDKEEPVSVKSRKEDKQKRKDDDKNRATTRAPRGKRAGRGRV